MDAVEYLRQRSRMFRLDEPYEIGGRGSFLRERKIEALEGFVRDELKNPAMAVRIVEQWAFAQRGNGVHLSAMDERFVRIYIDKGYLWAARNKNGELWLYIKEPTRGEVEFTLKSPALCASRMSYPHMLPSITWENSPVCLPRLLERRER